MGSSACAVNTSSIEPSPQPLVLFVLSYHPLVIIKGNNIMEFIGPYSSYPNALRNSKFFYINFSPYHSYIYMERWRERDFSVLVSPLEGYLLLLKHQYTDL